MKRRKEVLPFLPYIFAWTFDWTRLNVELNWTRQDWIELFPDWIELAAALPCPCNILICNNHSTLFFCFVFTCILSISHIILCHFTSTPPHTYLPFRDDLPVYFVPCTTRSGTPLTTTTISVLLAYTSRRPCVSPQLGGRVLAPCLWAILRAMPFRIREIVPSITSAIINTPGTISRISHVDCDNPTKYPIRAGMS